MKQSWSGEAQLGFPKINFMSIIIIIRNLNMAMLTRKKENFTIGAKIKNLNVYEDKSVIYIVNSDEKTDSVSYFSLSWNIA